MQLRRIVFLPPILLFGCGAGKLPPDLKDTTQCVYGVLKASPRIEQPTVYSIENTSVVIVYGYRDKRQDGTHELFVGRRPLDGEPNVVGDYPALPALAKILTDRLAGQCHVHTGYVDQVAITGPGDAPNRWYVDMKRLR